MLEVQLLGMARVETGAVTVAFTPDKRYRLLAYLAYRGDWVRRDELSFLFWPDAPDSTARHSLRQLLKRVRKLDWLSGLEADEHHVRWPAQTDVAAFRRAAEQSRWEEALSVYRGSLLEGWEACTSSEFESWLSIERQYLHSHWREALLVRAQQLTEAGTLLEAAMLLAKLLECDALDEDALRLYMETLSRAGRRERALAAYRSFAERLRVELDLEPTTTTQQLAADIKRTDASKLDPGLARAVTTLSASPTLPTPTTSFVGRDLELSSVAHLISQPDCRLLTLTGLGGVGKSRIALQAAEELAPKLQGRVYFVPLESLSSAQAIPEAIAAALQLALQGADDPLAQVTRSLEDKQALLLLDNFEVVSDGAHLAAELLRKCPKLKLLITSRERLNLEEEWLLPLEGLAIPEDGVPLEEALTFDAVNLFVQRARRVRPNFAPDERGLPHVLNICRLTQGFPLALELAAVWVRLLPLSEIAREVEANLDFLATPSRNAAPRQRSMRAVFEHSWQRLTPKEREGLRRLSVFRGGFTRGGAAVVAGVSIAVLAALLDKSLFRLVGDGRYDRHPLIHQYTQEKLAAHLEAQAETRARHARYFLALVEQAELHLKGAEQVAWLRRLTAESDNIREALAYFEASDVEAGLRLAGALGSFWRFRGHYQEGLTLLGKALERSSKPHVARAKALLSAGHLTWTQGQHDVAQAFYDEALMLAKKLEHAVFRAEALSGLARIAFRNHGDGDRARRLYQQSLALYQHHDDKHGLAVVSFNLAAIAREQGAMEMARDYLEHAFNLFQELGDARGMADTLKNLGNRYYDQGDMVRAKPYYQQSLDLYQEVGDRRGEGMVLSCLGLVAAQAGNYQEARGLHEASLAIYRERGDRHLLAQALVFLAHDVLATGEFATAHDLLTESLALQRELGNKWHKADALRALGDVYLAQDKQGQAAACYRESLDLSREVGDKWGVAHTLGSLALYHLGRSDPAASQAMLVEALTLAREMKLTSALVQALDAVAQLAIAHKNFAWAAGTMRLAESLCETAGLVRHPLQRDRHKQCSRRLRSALSSKELERVQAVSLDEVIEVLQQPPPKALQRVRSG